MSSFFALFKFFYQDLSENVQKRILIDDETMAPVAEARKTLGWFQNIHPKIIIHFQHQEAETNPIVAVDCK